MLDLRHLDSGIGSGPLPRPEGGRCCLSRRQETAHIRPEASSTSHGIPHPEPIERSHRVRSASYIGCCRAARLRRPQTCAAPGRERPRLQSLRPLERLALSCEAGFDHRKNTILPVQSLLLSVSQRAAAASNGLPRPGFPRDPIGRRALCREDWCSTLPPIGRHGQAEIPGLGGQLYAACSPRWHCRPQHA